MTDARELMITITKAFEEGDVRPLLKSIHNEIVWRSASGHADLFRFGGTHKGRDGVIDAISNIGADYTFHRLGPKEIIAYGDVVWGLFDAEISYKPLRRTHWSKRVRLEMAIRWRLKDGKIIEHQAFFDTASLLLQQGHSVQLKS